MANNQASTSPRDFYFDSGRLHTLQVMLCSRLDDLFSELGISFQQSSKMYYGPCPIHVGDNPNAINLYQRGDLVPGYWRCNTHRCHETFKSTIIGFVRGLLSQQKGWSLREKTKTVSFREAVDWCCRFLGQRLDTLQVDYSSLDKRVFTHNAAILSRKPEQERKGLTRGQVRERLQIPATYFVERGWNAEILNKYDVGLCTDPSKPFNNRVVVPVYDNDYRCVAGYTARSIYPLCQQCNQYHAGVCPNPKERLTSSKWRNSNFNAERHLYNYWFSKKFISKTGIVCLCEGPGDLWRLEEAGIHIGVAMFGASLYDTQQVILETSGATSVVVLTNMDDPGRAAAEKIRNKLKRSFRVYTPELPKKDLGEMLPVAVCGLLKPLLERILQ